VTVPECCCFITELELARGSLLMFFPPWISLLPLNKRPAFVSTDIPLEDLPVSQFIADKRKWDVESLSLIVNSDLLSIITSIPLSVIVVRDSFGF